MATPVQNFTTAVNAILDEVTPGVAATNAQLIAVGDAYLAQATSGQILALFPGAALLPSGEVDKAALSQAQRASVVLRRWHYEIRNVVKTVRRETDQATADALLAAGQAEAGAVI